MTAQSTYLLDADSFIRSKREHYAFDICPGYWDALLQGFRQKRLKSIVPVRKELMRGKDALTNWVKDKPPKSFFEAVDDTAIEAEYAKVIQWVQASKQYSAAAKQKFASGADPWLIAFASANQHVVVTYEVSSSESKFKIKLPDVAKHFGVKCIPPYVMLRQIRAVFNLEKLTKN